MPRRDIGVAIGIPEPYSAELQTWRERLGDPSARQVPPHVTLLPPTAVTTDRLAEVEEHLRLIAAEESEFEIHLRGTGTFRPVSPVVFVNLASGLAACERIEAKVRRGPLERVLGFPYHPHVTVAQDVSAEALDRGYTSLATYEARFTVWGFSMFERSVDGMWRPQRDFAFGAALPGPQVG